MQISTDRPDHLPEAEADTDGEPNLGTFQFSGNETFGRRVIIIRLCTGLPLTAEKDVFVKSWRIRC